MRDSLKGFIKPGSKEAELIDQLNFSRLPQHVAVIMDGNGRWAKKRNLPRVEGHRAGAKSVQAVVETSARLGIGYLTLYAFSKENWKRPKKEIATLWRLLEDYLRKEDKVLVKNKIRLKVIGEEQGLPDSVLKELARVVDLTKDHTGLTILLALNYGGRQEILDAIRSFVTSNDRDIQKLDEAMFSKYLYTNQVPDPDLLIRTSGEMRISNFLLWQVAYAEIYVTSKYWPDFRTKDYLKALLDYQKRERRFGDIRPQVT